MDEIDEYFSIMDSGGSIIKINARKDINSGEWVYIIPNDDLSIERISADPISARVQAAAYKAYRSE